MFVYLAFCETALTEKGSCKQDETFWKSFSSMVHALEWCSLNSTVKLTWDDFDDEFMSTSWVEVGKCFERVYVERHEVLG